MAELELVRLYDGMEGNGTTDFDLCGTQLPAWQDREGVIYYEGCDYTRDGTYSVYTEDGFYYLKDNVVYQDAIRQKEHFFSREDGQEDEIHYYNYNKESDTPWDSEEITEEQYEAIREEYVRNMEQRSVYQNRVCFRQNETLPESLSEEAIRMELFQSALGSR